MHRAARRKRETGHQGRPALGENIVGSSAAQATLDIANGVAPATWTGTVNLAGDALLEFASGENQWIEVAKSALPAPLADTGLA